MILCCMVKLYCRELYGTKRMAHRALCTIMPNKVLKIPLIRSHKFFYKVIEPLFCNLHCVVVVVL